MNKQINVLFNIEDNTGAKKCASLVNLSKTKKPPKIGDTLVGVIKAIKKNSSIKKGKICRFLVIRTKNFYKRKGGTYIRFFDNAAVLIDSTKNPLGTRIFGPVPKEIRFSGFSKVLNIAESII